MQTTLECLPCFMKQALNIIRLAANDPQLQQRMALQAARAISDFSYRISPPENAEGFYRFLSELADNSDPFSRLKKESTKLALELRPTVQKKIAAAAHPLLAAVKFAMAGNIIDYGAQLQFDAQQAIAACLATDPVINDFDSFQKDVAKADNILLLADNCGELVFDGLLVEQLGGGKKITIAVKESPIINDATLADARDSGLSETCLIISNGTACPGTPLARCSPELQQHFRQADLIISKGQGNFESLSEVSGPIYFLLTVKCEVVARHICDKTHRGNMTVRLGDMVLLKNGTVTSAAGAPCPWQNR